MIDGIKCTCVGLNAGKWLNNPALDFVLGVSSGTGEILFTRSEAKHKGMTFAVTRNNICTLSGSLHKFKNNGTENWDNFCYSDLQAVINQLKTNFSVNPETAVLHGVEFGVNIPLRIEPYRITKNAICHKSEPFQYIDANDKRAGVVCVHDEYNIKLYNKGRIAKTAGGYILRFEIKFKKMRMLRNIGIYSLSDLLDTGKLEKVLPILLQKIKEVIFFDDTIKTDCMTEAGALRWERFSNPNYWSGLNRNCYYKARQLYKRLIKRYKAKDWGEWLENTVSNTYQSNVQSKRKNWRQFHRVLTDWKQKKVATISQLEYVRENVAYDSNKTGTGNVTENTAKTADTKRRFCKSCGRDITNQRAGSCFCSEKMYGKEAKKCRNKDSNRRRTKKRKLLRALQKKDKIILTYSGVSGKSVTRILRANKKYLVRAWLDRITDITIIKQENKKENGTYKTKNGN